MGMLSVIVLGIESCKNPPGSSVVENSKTDTIPKGESESPSNPKIPAGYIVFDEMQGDLNGDGSDDYVVVVKGTSKEMIVQDEYRGELDRNRRGILIYLTNNGKMDLVTQNLECFSSENEEGGVYFPPELSVEIANGKLFVHFGHGRYGYWQYTFRYQHADFELIGYDASENYGPIVNRETSINFLTKKKLVRENVNENAEESGDEIFEETWEDLGIDNLYKLSAIQDFDSLEIY